MIQLLPPWASNIFYFIARTAVRRGEACDLEWKDIDFAERTVTIYSIKGGIRKSRTIPFSDDISALLVGLQNIRSRSLNKSKFVFLGPTEGQIQRANLSRLVSEIGTKLGIENAGLHSLRHKILTGLASSNQSGSNIRMLAGHSSLSTTQIYLHNNTEEMRKMLNNYEKEVTLAKPRLILEKFGS